MFFSFVVQNFDARNFDMCDEDDSSNSVTPSYEQDQLILRKLSTESGFLCQFVVKILASRLQLERPVASPGHYSRQNTKKHNKFPTEKQKSK